MPEDDPSMEEPTACKYVEDNMLIEAPSFPKLQHMVVEYTSILT